MTTVSRVYQLVSPSNPATDNIFQPPSLGTFSTVYNNKTAWIVLAIVLSAASLVMLVVFLFLRSRISLAIELIEEGSKAISTSLYIVAFPLLPFFCQAVVFAWFCLVASYLASSGEMVFQVSFYE
jgi:hypothetical protein